MNRKSTPKFDRNLKAAPIDRLIREFRLSLGDNQRNFAERIGASQTQVSEWERGTEKPSAEKLIAMGNAATTGADTLKFWRAAGIADDRLRKYLAEENTLALQGVPEGASVSIPLTRDIFIGRAGTVQVEAFGVMSVPSVLFRSDRSTFCLESGELCRSPFPSAHAEGDYLVIERGSGDLDSLEGTMVAVYLEKTPQGFELSQNASEALRMHMRKAVPPLMSEGEMKQFIERVITDPRSIMCSPDLRRIIDEIETLSERPSVIVGRLVLDFAGGEKEKEKRGSEDDQLSTRLALEFPGGGSVRSVPLGKWEVGRNLTPLKIAERISGGTHILGRVVGWFEDRRSGGK